MKKLLTLSLILVLLVLLTVLAPAQAQPTTITFAGQSKAPYWFENWKSTTGSLYVTFTTTCAGQGAGLIMLSSDEPLPTSAVHHWDTSPKSISACFACYGNYITTFWQPAVSGSTQIAPVADSTCPSGGSSLDYWVSYDFNTGVISAGSGTVIGSNVITSTTFSGTSKYRIKYFSFLSANAVTFSNIKYGQPCGIRGDPSFVGCSDGTREWFFDMVRHPFIAGCSGSWSVVGLRSDVNTMRTTPTCSRQSGNTGTNLNGTGCSTVDLCAPGWSVCSNAMELMTKSGTNDCDNSNNYAHSCSESGNFFASGQGSSTVSKCEPGRGNDIYGCGRQDDNSSMYSEEDNPDLCSSSSRYCNCNGADKMLSYSSTRFPFPWTIDPSFSSAEQLRVTKVRNELGGVLCCKDDVSQCPAGQYSRKVDIGCADGTREYLDSLTKYPDIAGCAGGWSVPGLASNGYSVRTRSCSVSGNSSPNPSGTGCTAADLCQPGWKICESARDMMSNLGAALVCPSPTTTIPSLPGSQFYATAMSVNHSNCTTNINAVQSSGGGFGCGRQNAGSYCLVNGGYISQNAYTGRDYTLLDASWNPAGGLPRSTLWNVSRVIKTNSNGGGVLCCRIARSVCTACADGTCASPIRPTVTRVTPSTFATSGGTVLTIDGFYFGASGTVFIGGVVCSRSAAQYYTDTKILCTLPAGTGRNVSVSVTSTTTAIPTGLANFAVFSYLPPTVTSITGVFQTQGGNLITITGTNFGISTAPSIVVVQFNGVGCPISTTGRSHTVIQCTLPAGVGQVTVTVWIQGQWANNRTFIYAAPTISTVSPRSWTTGGTYLTISGANFGPGAIVLINGASCSSAAPNPTRTSMFCFTPPGVGTQNILFLSVGGQNLTWSGRYAYNRPGIYGFVNRRYTTADLNSLRITVTGIDFGPPEVPMLVTIGIFGTFNVTSHTQTQAIFSVDPFWTTKNQSVTLFVAGQSSYCTDTTFSCSVNITSASIQAVRGCVDRTSPADTIQCPMAGGTDITIFGFDFGNMSTFSVRVGSTQCQMKFWNYSTSGTVGTYTVICTMAFIPSGGTVWVYLRDAARPFITFRAPVMSYSSIQRCPAQSNFDILNNFASVQNQSNWSYLSRQSSVLTPLSWNSGISKWSGGASIYRGDSSGTGSLTGPLFYLEPSASSEAVLGWFSPVAGSASLRVFAADGNTGCGNGVIISILQNQLEISRQTLNNGNSSGFVLNFIRSVRSEDYFYVVVNSNGDSTCDATIVNASISFNSSPSTSISTSGSVTNLNPYGGDCVAFRVNNIDGASASQIKAFYGNFGQNMWLQCANLRVAEPWIFCDTVLGVGRNLYFSVQIYEQWTWNSSWWWVIPSNPDSISYLDVVLVENSIRRNISAPGVPSYTSSTNNPMWIYFDVINLPTNTWIWPYLKVVYGSNNGTAPKEYACTSFQVVKTASAITVQCLLDKGRAVTEQNYFQIYVFNYFTANSNFTFQYPIAPRIDVVTGCEQNGIQTVNCPTEGGVELTIFGNYFCDFTTPNCSIQVLIGIQNCIPSYNSTQMITCTLPVGNGVQLPMQLIETIYGDKGFQVSKLNIVSYALATIESVIGCPANVDTKTVNCSRFSSTRITVSGQNFGKDGASVYLNGFPCRNLLHDIFFPHRQVTCSIDAGKVVDASIILVQSEGALSANSGFASYYQCDPGTIGNAIDNNCASCNAGYYTPVAGSTSCAECVYGTYASDIGSSNCIDCLAGYFSRLNATTCSSCARGTYSSTDGSFNCVKCDAGYFNANLSQSTCLKCNEGSFAGGLGLSSCDLCGPGTFSAIPGSVSCKICPQGMYIGISGATACELCPAGKIPGKANASHEGNSTCVDCNPGFYSSANAQPACLACAKGSFSSMPAATTCRSCSPGFNSSEVGMSSCGACDAGAYAPGSGNIVCIPCNSGAFNNVTNSSSCILCPLGQYQFFTSQSFCDSCSPGYYNNLKGQAQCSKCRPGTVAPFAAELCYPCSAGQYPLNEFMCGDCEAGSFTSESGQQACKFCEAGQFQPLRGQQLCKECEQGFYQADIGQKSCKPCDPGKFAAALSQVMCERCPQGRAANAIQSKECEICTPGSYQNIQGASSCLLCPAGNYSVFFEQASCPPCERGTYSFIEGSTACMTCLQGFYQDATGQSRCRECEVSTYNKDVKATICADCEPGFFGNTTGAFQCNSCLAGYYQEFPRRSSCLECIPGRYSGIQADTCLKCSEGRIAPSSASSDCFACPNNAGSSEDRTKCICAVGYYSNRTTPTSPDFTCKKCPIGANCVQSGITWETLETSVGYWRASVNVDRFYRCQFLASCLGGRNSTCAFAKVGPICSLCAKGYETFGSACRPCGSEQASTAVFVLMLFVITGLLLGMYYAVLKMDKQTVMKARRKMEGGDQAVYQDEVMEMLKDDTIREESTVANGPSRPPNFVYKLKILLGFFQIAVGIAFTIEIPWPDTFKQFISLFNIANFDLVQWTRVGCVVETNFYSKHLMVCVMPIAFFAALTLFYLFPQYVMKVRASYKSPQTAQESAWNYTISVRKFWKMTLFTMFLIYPQVSSIIIRLYACTTVEGETYLSSDFSVLCSTQKWRDRAQINIPFVALYPFGFLAFVALILFRKRHELQKPENLIQFGFLYAAYAHDRWWFELLDMLHRMVMTSMIALLPQEYALPTILGILCFHAAVILVTNPYTRKSDDLLHLLVQSALFVMVMAGYVYVKLVDIPEDIDSALSVIFIGMTIALVTFVVISIGLVLRKYLISWRKKRRAARVKGIKDDARANRVAKLFEMTSQGLETNQETMATGMDTAVAGIPTNTEDDESDHDNGSVQEHNRRSNVWNVDPTTQPNTLRLSAENFQSSFGGIAPRDLNSALRKYSEDPEDDASRANTLRFGQVENRRSNVWNVDPSTQPNTLRLSAENFQSSFGGVAPRDLNSALRKYSAEPEEDVSRGNTLRLPSNPLGHAQEEVKEDEPQSWKSVRSSVRLKEDTVRSMKRESVKPSAISEEGFEMLSAEEVKEEQINIRGSVRFGDENSNRQSQMTRSSQIIPTEESKEHESQPQPRLSTNPQIVQDEPKTEEI